MEDKQLLQVILDKLVGIEKQVIDLHNAVTEIVEEYGLNI